MSEVGAKGQSVLTDLYWRIRVYASYIAVRFSNMPKRFARVCNICGYEGYFGPAGGGRRFDAKCPRCKSAERYRLFKLWLDRHPGRLANADVLHFAPEKSMIALIKPDAKSYLTGDIQPGKADRVLNIEAVDLPDASFDCVVCSHILEHVDDKKALSEIHRVLRPGGLAVIMIPVIEGWPQTYENPHAVTRDERTIHFGQYDHVRQYGADVRGRILAAGFSLSEFTAEGPDVARYGLLPGEKVFLAAKPV
jgi:SAM-dependent methyltransferase